MFIWKKILLFHKAFKKLTSVLHQSLLEKIRSSGVGDIQSHWRETCYYYDRWSANAGLSEEDWFIFVLLDKLLLKSWLILELDEGQRLFGESRNTEWQLCDLRKEFCIQMVKGWVTVRENDGSWAFRIRAGKQKEKQNSCQGI